MESYRVDFRFVMVPAAVLTASSLSAPAAAATFLSLEEAQQLIFPGARFAPADLALTDEQANVVSRMSGVTVYRNQVKMWKVSGGGWFFLDQVPGRDDRITYALGLNPDGSIKAIEILVCDAGYTQVRGAWRRNFVGRRHARVHLSKEIPNISGSTLSVAHISDGVTKLLAIHALYVAPRKG